MSSERPRASDTVSFPGQGQGVDEAAIPESAARILRLKTELVEHFAQLPPEHQATLSLALLQHLLKGEWGTWLRDALTIQLIIGERVVVPPGTNQVSRENLQRVGFTEEEMGRLSDTDLGTIATIIHEHYVNEVFWDELRFATDVWLDGQEQKSS